MKRALTFGWRTNRNADGFEQDHGRFTMEVWWFESQHEWKWSVWAATVDEHGKRGQTIIAQGRHASLEEAKKAVLREASALEKDSIAEDKKFR